MRDLTNALWIELRKTTRSRMPLFTALASLILPIAGGFFMFVYKYPEFARNIGLVSAKANLTGGTADWPSYLSLLAQGMALAGIMLFSFIESWVFGREFADGTLKDLLAVPVPRSTVVLAKFVVVALWSLAMAAMIYIASFILGLAIGLPQGTTEVFLHGSAALAITAGLTLVDILPVAFFASAGRGYLVPVGIAVLTLMLTNLIVVAGWGGYFPWSVPALYAGTAGSQGADLGPVSYGIVALTGLAGVIGTILWWKLADQNR